MASVALQPVRLAGLDRVRGLAIALMVVDHAAAVFGSPWWLRQIVTRPALPLFMVVSGYLWRPGWRWRHGEVAVAAVAATGLTMALGLPWPEILGVYLAVSVVGMWAAQRWPLAVVVVGLLQAVNVPVGWGGYEPGYVLALLALGQLAGDVPARAGWADRLPGWLEALGRYPLTFYVGHLMVLVGMRSLGVG